MFDLQGYGVICNVSRFIYKIILVIMIVLRIVIMIANRVIMGVL